MRNIYQKLDIHSKQVLIKLVEYRKRAREAERAGLQRKLHAAAR